MPKINLIALILIMFQLTACSTKFVQSDRLKSAESYLVRAEQAISSSPNGMTKISADADLGTAKAYLETLRDNKKFLTDDEKSKYQALKQRASKLTTLIRK